MKRQTRGRRNSGFRKFQFMGFSFDIAEDYALQTIIIPGGLTRDNQWRWENGELFIGGLSYGSLDLANFEKLASKTITSRRRDYEMSPGDSSIIGNLDSTKVASVPVYFKHIITGAYYFADKITLVFRKKSSFDALIEGFETKENPQRGFPDQIEIPCVGIIDLPTDLGITSLSFLFPGEFSAISCDPEEPDLEFRYYDSKEGAGRFISLPEALREINSLVVKHSLQVTLSPGKIDPCLDSFSKGKASAVSGYRTDVINIYQSGVRIGSLSVIGKVLSSLGALIRGVDMSSNPRKRNRR
jgi:hypothetical protein